MVRFAPSVPWIQAATSSGTRRPFLAVMAISIGASAPPSPAAWSRSRKRGRVSAVTRSGKRQPDDLLAGEARRRQPGAVDRAQVAGQIAREDQIVRVLDQLAVALLALPDGRGGGAPLGHVVQQHHTLRQAVRASWMATACVSKVRLAPPPVASVRSSPPLVRRDSVQPGSA